MFNIKLSADEIETILAALSYRQHRQVADLMHSIRAQSDAQPYASLGLTIDSIEDAERVA